MSDYSDLTHDLIMAYPDRDNPSKTAWNKALERVYALERENERLREENDKLCYWLGLSIPFVATCAHESTTKKERELAAAVIENVKRALAAIAEKEMP